ncbi:hypothetical protein [Halomarina rubra]|uniref:Uncharacterized protein n=1 Tax=Halomarina rubra TaxID=2071873 RepID=A0ABD6B1B6_9EURY|nr:hypothetical protein [Halomarina rubra]
MPEAIWARLTAADDSVTVDVTDVLGGKLELRHSAISTADIEFPPRTDTPGLILGEAELFYGNDRLFGGEIGPVPGPTSGDTHSVQIRGPAAHIDGGDLSLSLVNRAAWREIQRVWDEHTPFSATVYAPERVTYLGTGTDDDGNPVPFETSGTVLNVLQNLHQRAGMRFTVRHDDSTPETPVVESYVPSEQVRSANWTYQDHDSKLQPNDYANRITVYGRQPDDPAQPRPQWTTVDWDEVDRYGYYPRPDGLPIWDSELTTSLDCQERAESELADRVNDITLSGSVEITPQLVHPGYHRPVPAFDGLLDGDTLPLDRVSMSFLGDEPTATLEFATADRLADKLVSVARQASQANRLL